MVHMSLPHVMKSWISVFYSFAFEVYSNSHSTCVFASCYYNKNSLQTQHNVCTITITHC